MSETLVDHLRYKQQTACKKEVHTYVNNVKASVHPVLCLQNALDLLSRYNPQNPELIAIITYMLHLEPDLEWLVKIPLPAALSRKSSLDPQVYRQQVQAAMTAGDYQRKRKRDEVQQRLTAIKSIAEEFAAQENYSSALTIYEVLITEIIQHFNDYRDEYIAFSVILTGCIDGLNSCFVHISSAANWPYALSPALV